MKWDEKTEEYTLSSGKVIYANKGLLSVHTDGTLYDGYDSSIGGAEDFSKEEKLEIATEMIKRWEAWRDE